MMKKNPLSISLLCTTLSLASSAWADCSLGLKNDRKIFGGLVEGRGKGALRMHFGDAVQAAGYEITSTVVAKNGMVFIYQDTISGSTTETEFDGTIVNMNQHAITAGIQFFLNGEKIEDTTKVRAEYDDKSTFGSLDSDQILRQMILEGMSVLRNNKCGAMR